jgi:DNA-directed RNA polymerase specialized sigma24 family protein
MSLRLPPEILVKKIEASFRSITGISTEYDIEECVQSVLLEMLKGHHQHATTAQAVTDYLRRQMGRKGHKYTAVRKQIRNYVTLPRKPNTPAAETPHIGDYKNITKFLRRIPDNRTRLAFVCFYAFDFTKQEIARTLGISSSRVGQILRDVKFE